MTMSREKAIKDLAQYNAEMKELERVIAHDCNLKDFMATKCSEKSGQDDSRETGHRRRKTTVLRLMLLEANGNHFTDDTFMIIMLF